MQERKARKIQNEKEISVLQVLDFVNHNSGVSAIVVNYYSNMPKERVKCDFLLYEEPEADLAELLKQNGAKIYVSGQPEGRNILQYRKKIRNFFDTHGEEYDMIHVHIPNAAFIILESAKRYGIPVRILHSHNARGADGIGKKIRNYVLNKWGIFYADEFFACSKSAGRYLFGESAVAQEKVRVIPNAVDVRRYRYSEEKRLKMRRELGVENNLVLGHVGRFAEQKNHVQLIDIFYETQKRYPDAKLLLLGDGPLRLQVEEKIKQLGIADKVMFVGTVDHVWDYMQAMDIFLLPSLYEGLPVVCVEAQAADLPCLLSDRISDEIKLTENVYFLDNGDIAAWVDKIGKVRYHLRKDDINIEDYNIEQAGKKLEEIYNSLWNKYKS